MRRQYADVARSRLASGGWSKVFDAGTKVLAPLVPMRGGRADAGADEPVLAENRRRLVAAGLAVVDLPMPPTHRVGGEACPASYANFYLANGVALVPVFGAPSDARALDVLRELLPGREVVGIRADHLVLGLGAVHCLSQQEPAPAGGAAARGEP